MKIFGLTGGIACGKTTVARVFEANGVRVLDADNVARLVVEPGEEAYERSVSLFGPESLNPDGTLNRKYIGDRIFARTRDGEVMKASYEAFIHAAIYTRSQQILAEWEAEGVEVACYDAALLVEKGMHTVFRPLVVVTCEPPTQLARLMARSNLTEREARYRINSQFPMSDKVKVADLVIRNDRSQAELEAEAVRVLREVRHRLGFIRHSLRNDPCEVCGEPECTLFRIAEFVQHTVEKASRDA